MSKNLITVGIAVIIILLSAIAYFVLNNGSSEIPERRIPEPIYSEDGSVPKTMTTPVEQYIDQYAPQEIPEDK